MILLIDTTTNPACIGFYDGKLASPKQKTKAGRLRTKTIESNPENNRKLVSIIEKFGDSLEIGNWKLEIKAIGLVNGPGAFTGVRTGVTIANAIAYALKAPVYAIDTLTAQVTVGAQFIAPNSKKGRDKSTPLQNVVSLLSASNSEVYFARVEGGKMQGKIEIVNIENNLKNRLKKGDYIVGDLKCEHAQSLTMWQYNNITSEQRVKNLLDLILEKRIKPTKQILPLYIKKPNITLKKEDLFKIVHAR